MADVTSTVLATAIIGIITFSFKKIIIPNYYERKIVLALKQLSENNKDIWFNKQQILMHDAFLSSNHVLKYVKTSKKIICNEGENRWALKKLYLQEKKKPHVKNIPSPRSFGF